MDTIDASRELKKLAYSSKKIRTSSGFAGTRALNIMLLPGLFLLLVYNYLPMIGLIISFEDFHIEYGISSFWRSPWVGLAHFQRVFSNPDATRAITNTVILSLGKMVTMFIVPLLFSLLLNEIRKSYIKRSIQTLIYLPHFLSWVILAGILKDIFSGDGLVNSILHQLFGIQPVFWLGSNSIFPHIIIWSNVWKEFGFSTIIFLAAITNIDPCLYESAIVDGANRWKQTLNITIPGMKSIIILCLVLSLGGILNAGFDQVFNLYSVPVYSSGDILDTLVYRLSILQGQYDLGTAVNLFKSVVSMIFISLSYWLAYRYANYEIF